MGNKIGGKHKHKEDKRNKIGGTHKHKEDRRNKKGFKKRIKENRQRKTDAKKKMKKTEKRKRRKKEEEDIMDQQHQHRLQHIPILLDSVNQVRITTQLMETPIFWPAPTISSKVLSMESSEMETD
jgi:hypothetical protein